MIIDTEIIMWIISGITAIVITILGYLFKSSIDNFKEKIMQLESSLKEINECVKEKENKFDNVYVRKDVYNSDRQSINDRFDKIDHGISRLTDKMDEMQTTIIELFKTNR